jgi:hypothetical protein
MLGSLLTLLLITSCSGENVSYPPEWGFSPEDVPEPQLSVLSDGEVTRAEYDSAVAATVSCIEREGLLVLNLEYDPELQQLGFGMTGSDSDEDIDRIYSSCSHEYDEFVSWAWVVAHQPSEDEVQLILERVGSCLAAKGYSLPESPAQVDINDVIESAVDTDPSVFDCMESY